MTLDCVHAGIDIPEYGTRVPWLAPRTELHRLIPAGALSTSIGGWPLLRFTCLGVTGTFGFNFVSHPESRLLEVQLDEPAPADIDRVFRDTAAVLRARLGDPNSVDMPDYHHLMWRDGRVWVNYSAGEPEQPDADRRHSLSVYFHAGRPRAWVPPGERTLGEVKRLLNLMPGVEVVEVRRVPGHTRLELTVIAPRSLARLTHMAAAANVGLQVGFDSYREANGELGRDDPAGILYQLDVPGAREPGPDGSPTTLQIVGLYLVDVLRRRGLVEEAEAERLNEAFNNHDG